MTDHNISESDLQPKGASGGTDPTIRYGEEVDTGESAPLLAHLAEVEWRIPKRLGKYEIHGRIGSGGMGVVFKGFDPHLERMVAIKVLQPNLAQSEVARRRFQREARAAAAISHENVLTIHAVEEQDQFPFLVMEYVSGTSLKDHIAAHGKLTALEIIRLSAQVAKGLGAAHAQGVIHRDIKPGNVMLHDGGTRVRLMDFGLARVAYDNSDLTSHDQTVGTPAYMSPEQVRGGPIDARSDLFSLGCVIYCMATGQSPFHGGNHAETIHRILDFQPPLLHQINPLIPPVVSTIVDHLLEKQPENRYQSSAEVTDALTHLVALINQTATDEVDMALSREVAVAPAPPQAALATAKPRFPSSWKIALIVLLLTVGTGAIVRNRSRGGNEPGSAGAASPVSEKPKFAEVIVGNGPDATARTLNEAVERVADGGVIQISPGAYPEQIELNGLESVTIRGGDGVFLRPIQPEAEETTIIAIKDCQNLRIEGLRLEASRKKARAVTLQGAVSGIEFENCEFLHVGDSSELSLVNVKSLEQPDQKPVRFHRCLFQRSMGKGYCVSADSREGGLIAIECEDCRFRSKDALVYLGPGTRKATLRRNVFLGGDTGINLRFKPWTGAEQIEISNNTFLGVSYWLSLMDSTFDPAVATTEKHFRLANNLILGGIRTKGTDDLWPDVLPLWLIQSNVWERDSSTTASADRGGRLATMVESVDIPNRTDDGVASFLRPAAGSQLGSQGAGHDLPVFVGAFEPLPTDTAASPASDSSTEAPGASVRPK